MRCLLACVILAACAATAEDPTPLRPWGERYRVILWCGDSVAKSRNHTNALASACRELGVTTLMTGPGGDPAPWLDAGFDYYVENIVSPGLCLKFRSTVTDWDAFVTAWSKGRGHVEFKRDYGLADPGWRERARSDMRQAAIRHAATKPILYDIRDELSVTVGIKGESKRVDFMYGDTRPLFDLRTRQKIGELGQARVDVPFERPALLGFSSELTVKPR